MRYFKLVVEYDGTAYNGFQIQPGVPTIQGELEKKLSTVLQHPVRVTSGSRTDVGVHAKGQVIVLGTDNPIDSQRLARALNNALPIDIAVSDSIEVPANFHPRYDARSKSYCYSILNCRKPDPFRARLNWHFRYPLDIEAMSEAARYLIGYHDFSAFEAAGSSIRNKCRTLSRLDCVRTGDQIEIHAQADGFLYRMVRNLVGTLVEVGRGKWEPGCTAQILASRQRELAGPTAPPEGLSLVRIDY